MYAFSIFVTFSRECTGTGWLVPQFSTCTLSKSTTNAFALIDITLVANSTSTVMQNESQILKEVSKIASYKKSQCLKNDFKYKSSCFQNDII